MVPTSSHAHFGLLESDLGVEMADEEDVLDSWEDADTEVCASHSDTACLADCICFVVHSIFRNWSVVWTPDRSS